MSLSDEDVESFREILRQQLLGDQELLRDAVAGREDPEVRLQVYDRLTLVHRLADELGLVIVDRRRTSRPVERRDGGLYLRVPFGALVIALGALLAAGAVYTTDRFLHIVIPTFFLPIVAFVTLRYGRRAGAITTAGCFALWMALYPLLRPYDRDVLVRGLLTFTCFLMGSWLIRRDVF